MTKTNRGANLGVNLPPAAQSNEWIEWHLEHPTNGYIYDVAFSKVNKTWTVEQGRFDEESGDWNFTTILDDSQRAPRTLLKECGVGRLIG